MHVKPGTSFWLHDCDILVPKNNLSVSSATPDNTAWLTPCMLVAASGDQDLNTISGPKTPASQPAYAPEGSQGASSGHTDTGLSQRQQDSDRSTEADVTERSQGAGRVGEPVFTQRQQDTSDEGNGHFLEEGCHAYQSKGEQDHAYQPEKEHGAHLGGYDDRHHNRHSQGDSDADAKRAFPGEAPVFIDGKLCHNMPVPSTLPKSISIPSTLPNSSLSSSFRLHRPADFLKQYLELTAPSSTPDFASQSEFV